MTHFLSIFDCDPKWLHRVLTTARRLRKERNARKPHQPVLAQKSLAMIFEKPSLRTRVSFEQAMIELGGHAIPLGEEIGLGKRESVRDIGKVLAGMVQGIAARVKSHHTLLELSEAVGDHLPVINMLSDDEHPAQALADIMTLQDEFGEGKLAGKRIVFVGDGNNVARSLAAICGKLGLHFTLAAPADYQFEDAFAARLNELFTDSEWNPTDDPQAAVQDADAIYADTFTSMGQEHEKQARLDAFRPYQINEELLADVPKGAIVLHCLPAYRGEEITDAVIDGPRSRVFHQAHNRLHAQKGLLAELLDT